MQSNQIGNQNIIHTIIERTQPCGKFLLMLLAASIPWSGILAQVEWNDLTQSTGFQGTFHSVAHDGSTFVAVGENSGLALMATSPDGTDWTDRNAGGGITGSLYGVSHANGAFVAVGSETGTPDGAGIFLTSPDGITWTKHTQAEVVAGMFRAVALGKDSSGQDMYIAVGNGANGLAAFATSFDGTNWADKTAEIGITGALEDIVFGNDTFYAVGSSGEMALIVWSNDGQNWYSGTENQLIGGKLKAIEYSEYNAKYRVVGERTLDGGAKVGMILATDSVYTAWQDYTDRVNTGNGLRGIASTNGLIVAVGATAAPGGVVLSTDTMTWTGVTAVTDQPGVLYDVCNGNDIWVAVGGDGTNGLIVSSNPSGDPLLVNPGELVYWDDGTAVLDNNYIYQSGDGVFDYTWSATTTEDWISSDPPTGTQSDWAILILVSENTSPTQRTGTVFINDYPVKVIQYGQGQLATPFSAPTGYFDLDGSVNLSWSPVEGAAGYDIQRREGDFAAWQEIATSVLAVDYIDPNPPAGIDLAYRVRARSGESTSAWSDIFELLAPPSAPTTVTAIAIGPSTVELSWSPSRGAGAYHVQKIVDDGGMPTYYDLAIMSANRTSFLDTSVAPDSTSSYRVAAMEDENGYSDAFTESNVITTPLREETVIWGSFSSDYNTYTGVAYGSLADNADRFVAVGPRGRITTMERLTDQLTDRNSGTSENLNSVAYGGGFVAVGDNGTIVTSTDGVAWTGSNSTVNTDLMDVAYGGGQFLAVGMGGIVIRSTDGTTWTQVVTPGDGPDLQAIAYGGGNFMAIAADGRFFKTASGNTWTLSRSAYGGVDAIEAYLWTRNDLAHLSGQWIAVGPEGYYSWSINDGQSFTEGDDKTGHTYMAIVTDPAGGEVSRVALGGYTNIGIAQSVTTERKLQGNLYGVAYGENMYVTVGSEGLIARAVDARDWTVLTDPIAMESVIEKVWNFGPARVALTNFTIASNPGNGTVWNSVGLEVSQGEVYAAAFGSGAYLVVGQGKQVIRSYDAFNWERVHDSNFGFDEDFIAVVATGDHFVAVSQTGVWKSEDVGTTWNQLTWNYQGYEEQLWPQFDIVRLGNRIVSLGGNFLGYWSDGGANWSLASVGQLDYGAATGNHLAVGRTDGRDRIISPSPSYYGYGNYFSNTSSDGRHWIIGAAGTVPFNVTSIGDIAFGNGIFVGVATTDSGTTLLASFDGTIWEELPPGPIADLIAINPPIGITFDGKGFLVGGLNDIFRLNIRASNYSAEILVNPTLNDVFAEVTDAGDGWYSSPWFGFFKNVDWPWIYHPDFGFLKVVAIVNELLVIQAPGAGWWATSPGIFPIIYSYDDRTWILP